MARFDVDGSGEREAVASVYTTVIYEQEFHSSIIKDVYGKVDLADGDVVKVVTADFVKSRLEAASGKELPKTTANLVDKAFPATVVTVLDYTKDNWGAYLKALWAMYRTADEVNGTSGTPGYKAWMRGLGPVDMRAISEFVIGQMQDNLFRSPAAGQQAQEG